MVINFFSQEISFEFSDKDKALVLIAQMAKEEQKNIDTINIVFVSDEKLLEINQQYLDHDYFTDVITFPYDYDPIHSDIFISIDRVKDNASSWEASFAHELRRVIIHGVLHMMGYKDQTEEQQKMIRNRENHYLDHWSSL